MPEKCDDGRHRATSPNGFPQTLQSFDQSSRNISLGQAISSPPEQKQLSTSIRHVLSCLSLQGSLPISGVGNH